MKWADPQWTLQEIGGMGHPFPWVVGDSRLTFFSHLKCFYSLPHTRDMAGQIKPAAVFDQGNQFVELRS
jgi:hypothetical protein